MNKKPTLTQEQKFLIHCYSKNGFTQQTLASYISQIKNNKITISDLSYLEQRYFEIFTIDKTTEFFTACQEEKEKLKQELNEI